MNKFKYLLFLVLMGTSASLFAQTRHISGTVYDENKDPMIGTVIKIVGQDATKGVITDIDGHFSLDVPNEKTQIELSSLGYKTQRLVVGATNDYVIQMKPDVSDLEEVVVTGYGTQKKVSIVGAIENLSPNNLKVGSTRSLSNNLAGQVAGVIAVRRSGEPGYDNSNFWIRGIATFSGATSPLVLVDGIERDLNNIDPEEIESFSVLKDASASAMYGVRGANGVIIINTKRGHIGAPQIDVRVEHSIEQPTKLPKFIDGADYMQLLNTIAADNGERALYNEQQIDRTRSHYDLDLYPNEDWLDNVTRDYAYSTHASLDVSGGSNFLRYSLVAAFYNEQGIVETDKSLPYDTGIKLNRYNVRTNVDLDITKTTTFRVNIGGYMQNRRGPNVSIDQMFSDAFTTSPVAQPARFSDGKIPLIANRVNPWAEATQTGYQVNIHTQLQSLVALEQDLKMITPGLKAKLTFSFDSYNESNRARDFSPTYYSWDSNVKRDAEGKLHANVLSYGSESLGFSSGGNYGNKNTYFEANLSYSHNFGKHAVDALFLYNMQSHDNGSVQPFRKQGIAGRLSYVYDDRYIGEFNFGYNGSENFIKGKRFGFFPSVSLGWLISEEHFMESARKTFNKIKIRGSYGKVGNDNIGGRRFAYITTVYTGQGGYDWGDSWQIGRTGITEGDPGVTNLTWETAWKANIGIELGLWNALDLQVDYFNEKRSNIFMQRSTIPTQTGFISTPWANYGKVTNKGFDASLKYNKRVNDDWAIGFRSTISYAKNRIDEIDESIGRKQTAYRSQTGRSMNTLWGLQAERLFTEEDFDENGELKFGIPKQDVGATKLYPGDIKYKDMNGDGVITDADEGYIGGTTDPRLIYGGGISVTYKNFDFNTFFQGVGDTYRVIGGSTYFIPGSGLGLQGNVYTNYEDRWTEDNPSQDVFWPRLSYGQNKQNYRSSTWWKKNMSFLRCKIIEIGYSLPKALTEKIGTKRIRFYVSGNNLFYISKFKLWDPELSSADGLKYPQMKTILMGVDVNF
ncbi:MAG: SusC/RagA family TonB-linked outer membrane protein [Prevotella sp.]|jgi:TonB-linked SusC/RagA family outer membrane protein